MPNWSFGPSNGPPRPPLIPPEAPLPENTYLSELSSETSVLMPLLGRALFDGVLVFKGMRSSSAPEDLASNVAKAGRWSESGAPWTVGTVGFVFNGGGDSARAVP